MYAFLHTFLHFKNELVVTYLEYFFKQCMYMYVCVCVGQRSIYYAFLNALHLIYSILRQGFLLNH